MPDNQLKPCEKCAPQAGRGAIEERFVERLGYSTSFLVPCDCAYGRALAKSKQKEPPRPILTPDELTIIVDMMGSIPYFPADSSARSSIGSEMGAICRTLAEATWLAQRMVSLYRKWPGVPDMRMVYCAKYRPLDGIEPRIESEVYPDGIPSEFPQAEPERPLLPARQSADFQLAAAIQDLAEAKRLPAPTEPFPAVPTPKIATTPAQKHFKPVTKEDVENAVKEHRERLRADLDQKAREEAGL